MNEHTTTGLIHLFALISHYRKDPASARKKVASFLQFSVGWRSKEEFLRLYDEFLDYYKIAGKESEPWIAQAQKVICKLEPHLTRKEIILVYLRLLELLSGLEDLPLQLIYTLSELLHIQPENRDNLMAFIHSSPESHSSPGFLTIAPENLHGSHHFIQRNIKGQLLIYFDPDVNLTVIRLIGEDALFIESRALQPHAFQSMEEGESILGNGIIPIHYGEIRRMLTHVILSDPLVLEADSLSYHFPGTTNGLHPFSFREKSGSLIAIMGSSGSGKTTLMNLLNGTLKPSSGKLLLNGFNVHTEPKRIEGIIGYVPQEEMLFEELSVYLNLWYCAKLTFAGLHAEALNEKVERTLRQLELEPVRELIVGNCLNKSISGGQRKRLNIALELIREPAILLIDEPTSGLSSTDALKVIQLLREQANQGKLILVNLHQPSSQIFRIFDSLWIMDQGGYVIFNGPPLDAISYFKKQAFHNRPHERECSECGAINPELIFRIIEDKKIDGAGQYSNERKNSPEDWYRLFSESGQVKKEPVLQPLKTRFTVFARPKAIKQFFLFFSRNLQVKKANKVYLLTTTLQTPLLALLTAWFTHYPSAGEYTLIQNKYLPIYLFIAVIISLFTGMMTSAEEIIRDRSVLKRERFLHLSWRSYLNSKVVYLFLVSAIQSLVFVLIGNVILQIHHLGMLYWSVLFSSSCVANLIGLNLSNALNSRAAIYIAIPVILIPQMLLGGMIVKFDDLTIRNTTNNHVPVAGNLATSRWAYEALAVGQFMYNDYQKLFFKVEQDYYNYAFYSRVLLHELERRVHQNVSHQSVIPPADTAVIRNELQAIYQQFPVLKSKAQVSGQMGLLEEITFVKGQLNAWRDDSEKELDSIMNSMNLSLGKETMETLRNHSTNNALTDLVLNNADRNQYRESKQRLIRLHAPVYKEPESNLGVSHFYSANKTIFGFSIETPYFNIILIWLQSLFLYLLLYFNVFKLKLSK